MPFPNSFIISSLCFTAKPAVKKAAKTTVEKTALTTIAGAAVTGNVNNTTIEPVIAPEQIEAVFNDLKIGYEKDKETSLYTVDNFMSVNMDTLNKHGVNIDSLLKYIKEVKGNKDAPKDIKHILGFYFGNGENILIRENLR